MMVKEYTARNKYIFASNRQAILYGHR